MATIMAGAGKNLRKTEVSSLVGKLEVDDDIRASPGKFHHMFAGRPHHVSKASPGNIRSCDLHEGEWGKLHDSPATSQLSVLVLDKRVPTASDIRQGDLRRQTKKDKMIAQVHEKIERKRKLAPSQQTPFKGNSTVKHIIPNKKVGQSYDPFAFANKKMLEVLTAWLKLDPYFKTPMDKKPRLCPSRLYFKLRTSLAWLNDREGPGSTVHWHVEYEKIDEKVAHPETFIEFCVQVSKEIDEHLLNEN
ncbi:hypothetical protein Bca52824_016120 [Brassica carinata]|uniref:Bet v I/Major latex protein domain-containing protein n=1 Tax=Brassica carinata TaxID=52824 RepID=A0A8X7W4G3_BRACI|nr:hypothetical protein Bca52824_016120 [Brassica carinata]